MASRDTKKKKNKKKDSKRSKKRVSKMKATPPQTAELTSFIGDVWDGAKKKLKDLENGYDKLGLPDPKKPFDDVKKLICDIASGSAAALKKTETLFTQIKDDVKTAKSDIAQAKKTIAEVEATIAAVENLINSVKGTIDTVLSDPGKLKKDLSSRLRPTPAGSTLNGGVSCLESGPFVSPISISEPRPAY
jgi:hypothetical protein